ncbi:MAG: hypothetical protein ACTFAK_16280 [Candidatus Electronema sp. VV]
MTAENTAKILSAITDAGLFERLATAILREAKSEYRSLAHPGVNADGKTVKSRLDGICFVQGADPPHMIAVQHTIADRDGLEKNGCMILPRSSRANEQSRRNQRMAT